MLQAIFPQFQYTYKFSGKAYQEQSRQVKFKLLWDEVQKDINPGSFPFIIGLSSFLLQSMDVTMNFESDVLPYGRRKQIHSVGNVAQAEFIPEHDTPYTGFFKGSDSLIVRLSCALRANPYRQAMDNFTPGLALKYLIDKQPSANLVAMYGVNGVPTWNFFEADISNHIGPPQGIMIKFGALKFATGTNHIQTVGLRRFAMFDQDGKEVQNPRYPWKLIFKAPENIKRMFSDQYEDLFTEQLKKIPTGSTLYEVYAVEDPEKGEEKKIGKVVLKTPLTTSKFGDHKLFFQHQKMEFDLEDNPKWKEYTPTTTCNFWQLLWSQPQTSKKQDSGCPFQQLKEQ